MYRRIVKQANNAYTLTLPIDWIKENNLDFGDYLKINKLNKDLMISSEAKIKNSICEVNLINKTRAEMFNLVLSKYILGFDEIIIKHNNLENIFEIEKELTGMIIEDFDESRAFFKSVVLNESFDYGNLLFKISLFLKELSSKLVLISKGEFSIEKLKILEKSMDKNILYALRCLYKFHNLKSEYNLFYLLQLFDLIGDSLVEISEVIENDVELATLVNEHLKYYLNSIFTDKMKGVKNNKNYKESDEVFSKITLDLRNFRNSIKKEKFVDGLVYSLAELLYNFSGILNKEDFF